ncbi:MAG TPA: hypothetical protein VMW46_13280 [Candidatus Desulfaltia sp.]|nr:hypothetical protein [Candidatus Desulfaltia sp.]
MLKRVIFIGTAAAAFLANAGSAEHGPVPLEGVENYILLLEKTGFVKIGKS